MEPMLLVRTSSTSKYELNFAKRYFQIEESRVRCQDALVIGRYSILPYYSELDRDLRLLGSRLINTPEEHEWIASFDYYDSVRLHTPETWSSDELHACAYQGPFVVKSRLKSNKHAWNRQMFAKTKRQALLIAKRLCEDAEIRERGVIFRKYVPLRTFEIGVNGLPYANEWRFFFLRDQLLSYGYYWSIADCAAQAKISDEGIELAQQLARIVANRATFFTLDLAETEDGDWILIEINDGQSSVPEDNDLDELYGNLKSAFATGGITI